MEEANRLVASEGRIKAIVSGYLCEKHRDNPGAGCALPAFAADMGRGSRRTKQSFSSKLEEMIAAIEVHLSDLTADEPRQQAIFAISTMMGTILLARASAGEALSAEILEAGAKLLTDHLSARLAQQETPRHIPRRQA
jgi:TetR/AcrR family transcriptional regulator, transcriptional repressor for nem operon